MKAGETYDLSLYARLHCGKVGPLQVAVEKPDGTRAGLDGFACTGLHLGKARVHAQAKRE